MKALTEERLFEPFMDPVDGVLCLPADSNATAIAAQAAPLGWRFPLWLDPALPLYEQVRCCSHAPASSRFGPYCDNITGMNWLRPDGRSVRVGERVVKSTTGYDLLRFLLESGERYGRPLDYVLRLRPLCDTSRVWHLHGERPSLLRSVSAVLHSSWVHWLESFDGIVDGPTSFLRAAVHCPNGETEAFDEYFNNLAKDHGLEIQGSTVTAFPADGLPDFVIKTTVDRVLETAFDLGENSGVRCVALCSSGVVLGYVSDYESVLKLLRPLESGLHAVGGEWRSSHIADRPTAPPESEWLATLCREWGGRL
ncbi:MAG: hypothetical protein ACOYM3_24890 [Terrimicrobiaceae bacterium]